MTLEGFLDARGSICYVESSACSTNDSDPFDPPSAAYAVAAVHHRRVQHPPRVGARHRDMGSTPRSSSTARCSRPRSWSISPRYIRDHATFGTQTVSFVFACMRPRLQLAKTSTG